MSNFEIKVKFRDKQHFFMYHACLEAGRIMLKVDRDFKIRKRKKK